MKDIPKMVRASIPALGRFEDTVQGERIPIMTKRYDMKHTPKDTDQFLVDIGHGHHYHIKECMATRQGDYRELSYGEIRAIRTYDGHKFEPDICVMIAQNKMFWSLYSTYKPLPIPIDPKKTAELIEDFMDNFPEVRKAAEQIRKESRK